MHSSLWRRLYKSSQKTLARRAPRKRRFDAQLRLESLEDRITPASTVLDWVGATGSAAAQGLNGQYFNINPPVQGSTTTNGTLQPQTAANPNWLGNMTPAATALLTGAIDFQNIAANGFQDNLGTTYYNIPGNNNNVEGRWFGDINIPNNGKPGNPISFGTGSDDGSVIYIDGNQVVNNDNFQGVGGYPTLQVTNTVNLTPGFHAIDVEFYQGGGGAAMWAQWDPAGGNTFVDIPNTVLVTSLPGPGNWSNALNWRLGGQATATLNSPPGTVTFSYNGTPAPTAFNYSTATTAGNLQTYINSIPSLPAAVTVTGAAGGPFTIAFPSADNPVLLTSGASSTVTLSPGPAMQGSATFAYNGTNAPTAFSFDTTTTAAGFQAYLATITSFTTTPTVAGPTGGPFTLTFNAADTPSLFTVASVTAGNAVYDGVSKVTFTPPPPGSATFSYNGVAGTAFGYDANTTAANLQAYLQTISGAPAGITVNGPAGGPFNVVFPAAGNPTLLTVSNNAGTATATPTTGSITFAGVTAVPVSGNTLVFNSTITGAGNYYSANDIAGLTLNGIVFQNAAGGSSYNVSGLGVTINNTDPTLTSGISDSSTGFDNVLGLSSIALGANTNIDNTSATPTGTTPSFTISSNIDMAGHVLSSGPSQADALTSTPDTGLTDITGVVSSSVANTDAVVESGYGVLALAGNNTYDGTTSVFNGVLVAAGNNSLGATTGGAKTVNPTASPLPGNPGAVLGVANGGDNAAYTHGVTIQGAGPSVIGGALWNADGSNNVFNAPITLAGATTFEINNGGSLSLGGALSLGSNALTLAGNHNLTMSGVITGSAMSSITDTNTATSTLTGNNTPFLGPININAGILAAGANNALGVGTVPVTVASGAALGFTNNVNYTTPQPVSITGSGPGGNGAVESISGTNSFAGTITSTGDEYLGAIGGTTTLSTPINLAANNLFLVGNGGNMILTGAITGPAASMITKNGTGTDTIANNNSATFTGSTIINQGVLDVTVNGALGTGGAITVNVGGGLGLSGGVTFTGAVSIAGSGTTGNGAIESLSGSNSFAGPITLTANASIGSDAGSLTLGGNVADGNSVLTFTGAGTTTVNGVISSANSGPAGLNEGQIANAFDTTNPANPAFGTDVVLSPVMAETNNTNNNGTPNPTSQHIWGNNDTWVYTGQILIGNTNGNGTGTVSFAKNVDDNTLLKINGTTYLNDTTWNNPLTTGPITLPAGWNTIEIRFGNGGGGAGASAQNNNGWTGWTSSIGFIYRVDTGPTDPLASSTNVSDYVIPTDNGMANLFRTSGTPGIVMNGTGIVVLNGANTYFGPTTINSGTLVAGNNNALSPTNGTGTTVNTGGALALPSSGGITLASTPAITISGMGPAGNGAIENQGSTNTIAAPISLAAAATIGSDAGLLTVSGNIAENFSLTFTGAGNTTVTGVISGTSAFCPGLLETQSSSGFDNTSATGNDPAAGSDIVLSPLMANPTYANANTTNNANLPNPTVQHIWSNNDTWFYQGQIFLAMGSTYQFFESVDDNSYLKIDGNVLLNGGAWGQTTSVITGDGNWHAFDARFGNGGGGAGPANTGGMSGFLVSVNGAAYAPPTDNGMANLFRIPLNLIKTGTGTLTLSNTNTYVGPTVINAGVLVPTVDGAMGPATAAGIFVNAGGALGFTGGLTYATAEPLTIVGSGPPGSSGAVENLSGVNSTALPITLGANATIGSSSGTLTLSGALLLNNANLTTTGAGNTVLAGVVSGASPVAPSYVGFTGATGGSGSVQTINDWTYSSPDTSSTPLVNFSAPGGFTGASNLKLNGNSSISGSQLSLTTTTGQTSSAFVNTLLPVNSFKSVFDFQMMTSGAAPYADGFTFLIQNNSLTALGGGGGGLGYGGISGLNLAVAFNMFNTVSQMGVDLNGVESTPIDLTQNSSGINFYTAGTLNGDTFHVVVDYNSTTLTVTITDPMVTGSSFTYSQALAPSSFATPVNAIIQNGTGTTTLSGNNTYDGLTTVTQGTLIAANSNALGSSVSGTVVTSGGTLGLQGGITLNAAETLTLSGQGAGNNSGALENISSTNTVNQILTLPADAGIGSAAGTLNVNGNVLSTNFSTPSNLSFWGAGNTVVNGVIGLVTPMPGLLESQSNNAFDNFSPTGTDTAAGTDIVLTTVMAESTTNNNASPPNPTGQHIWGNNDTWFYQGQIFLTAATTYTFYESVDDNTYLKIDQNVLLNGGAWGQTASIMGDGNWHNFDARFSNGGGGAGPNPGPNGFTYTTNGTTPNQNSPIPTDPGTGSGTLFRQPLAFVGNVIKNGSGTVTLAGTNTYTGNTTLNGGTLQVSADANLGVSTGPVNLNGGTLDVTTSFTTNRTITVGANNGTIQVDAVGPTAQTLTANLGIISSGGNLTKTGPGNLLLLGNGLAGNGTVTMAGGTLSLNGAGSTIANPLALQSAGFNQDVVWATSEANSQVGTSTAFDGNGSGTGNVFYQAGVPFTPGGGLPTNGNVVSPSAIFQLQPYTASNILYAPDTNNYTLTLSNPGSFQKLALLDSAANGAATFTVTLNYANGTSTPFTQIAPDWFASGGALPGVGRITRATSGLAYSGLPSNPSLFEEDLTLSAADQAKTLVSLTFTRQSGGQLGVFAVSGLSTTPPAAYNYNVVVTANSTINLATTNPNTTVTLGPLAIGTNTLTVTGTSGDTLNLGAVTLSGNPTYAPAANITLSRGALNDGGSPRIITLNGAGTLTRSTAATTVTAGTTVNVVQGTLNLTVPGALSTATAAALVNVASGQTVNLGAAETLAGLTGTGIVNLNGNTLTIAPTAANPTSFGGTLQDGTSSGGLTVNGTSSFTLAAGGTYSYTGPTTVSAGKLQVDGNVSASTATVSSGATLGGAGTVHGISAASGGIVAPGDSPGTLTTSSFSLATGAILQEEIGGTTAGTQYDQVVVATGGTVTLNSGGGAGATLNIVLVNGFLPAVGNTFTIINNQGTNAVSGTFAPGNTLTVNGFVYAISYTGGTNNDSVVLTVMAVPGPVTHFQVVASPASVVAGTPGAVSFTVSALDANNNVVPTYTGTVNFSSSDSQASFTTSSYLFTSGGLTSDDGVHTFTNYATLKTAGNQTITATDSSGNHGTSNAVLVTAGPFSQYAVGLPGGSTVTAGSSFIFTVQAADQYGNAVSSYTGPSSVTVTLSPPDPLGTLGGFPPPLTLALNSVGLGFSLGTLKTGGSYTLSVTGTQGINTYTGTSSPLTVTPAAATHFSVSAGAVAGAVAITATGASESGSTVTITTATPHGFSPGQSVNISGVGNTGYDDTVEITAVPSPTSFTYTALASNLGLMASGGGTVTSVATTGSAFNVVVTALDPYGNIATGYTGTVNLTSSDAAATFPVNHYTFTTSGATPDNGVHTFSATLKTPGAGQTITATDASNASLVGSISGGVFTVGLYLTAFATTPSGFTATFNKLVNSSQLDYYRFAGELVPPDISMTVGSSTTTVNGSVVVTSTATQTTLTFVNTGGALNLNQAYTITLGSGSNGILDMAGEQLAADANGVLPGTNYSASFTPVTATVPTLVIAGFARGPGSNVLLPNNTGTGIPVTLKNAPPTTTSVTFTLDYNPALLTITGPTSGNLVLNTVTSTPGVANFSFSTTTNLSTSSALLGNITANVPSSASSQYQAKALLDLPANLITIGGSGSPTFQSADGVEINAYLADVNGDHKIDGSDAGLVSAVLNAPNNAANQPAGFPAYRLADPALLGSPSSNPATATPKITGTDVTLINRFAANLAPAQIPAPPTGLTYTSVGPDPALSLPASLAVSSGGTVTVPVNLDDARPAGSTGLTEATLALTYDPQVLTVSASDVHLGTLPASGRGWTLTSVVNAVTGQLAITLESATPITQALSGSLVTIDFHVQPGAVPGATSVAVVETVDPTGHGLLQTSLFDNQGAFSLNPAPTNGPADPLTGLVVLTAPAPVPTIAVVDVAETAPVVITSTVVVQPAGSIEVFAETLPSVTAAAAAPLPGADDDEEPAGAEASPARAVRPTAHAAGAETVTVVASSGVLSAAQQAAVLVLQFGNAPALSVPLAAVPHLADAWFLALGRGTADLADRALLVSTLDETAGWVVPGVRGSVPSASDDLDGQLWDGAGSDLDWLPAGSAGPLARHTASANPTSEATAAAVVPERAALDQVFADMADDTTDQLTDEE